MKTLFLVYARSESCWHFPAILVMTFVFSVTSNRSDAQDFILLSNGNVIQGKIHSIGNQVIIDRGDGNEVRLAARQVLHSAPTLSQLYRYRQQQRQHPHVESYQDDARWCYRHQLYDEMEQALDIAGALDPTHPETLRLRRQLASATRPTSDIELAKVDLNALRSTPAAGQVVIGVVPQTVNRHQVEEASEAALAAANLSNQAVSYFGNRVQPLLINRCGNSGCHRSPTESQWQLTHMGVHVRPPSRMTMLNLLATLSIVNRESGLESDLLKYATTPHGGKMEAPLKRGDDAAVESLNEWVKEVNQHDDNQHDVTAAGVALTELPDIENQATPVMAGNTRSVALPSRPAPVRQITHLESEAPLAFDEIANKPSTPLRKPTTRSTDSRNRPTRLPTVENPFDPEIFNRNYRDVAGTSSRDR